jgi:protein ImuB
LSGIYLVAKEVTLRITFANKQSYERIFKIPQPTNDVDLLFRMLQTHLENFKSEHPIVAVALTAQPIKPVSQQFGLFEMALRNPQQLYETLARLTALLGADRVGTPVLEETHQPDAFRMELFAWNLSFAADTAASPEEKNGSRPFIALRRFRPPVGALIFSSENRHLQSEKIRGKVVEQGGPYLLSGNWWDEKSWARAEWDLQLEDGVLLRCHCSDQVWAVDGIYD